jgi:hypothetical protein
MNVIWSVGNNVSHSVGVSDLLKDLTDDWYEPKKRSVYTNTILNLINII